MYLPYHLGYAFACQECDTLARAMKEWERRPGDRKGFNDGPADCMAFKHLRDVSADGVIELWLAMSAAE